MHTLAQLLLDSGCGVHASYRAIVILHRSSRSAGFRSLTPKALPACDGIGDHQETNPIAGRELSRIQHPSPASGV
ncbi:MAG TPA: hypothetical protein VGJ91_00670, partial [Polyangiaceae bacterium]